MEATANVHMVAIWVCGGLIAFGVTIVCAIGFVSLLPKSE